MNTTNRWAWIKPCAITILPLGACNAPASAPTATPVPPTATSAPTATPVPPTETPDPREVWDYVALGSVNFNKEYPDLYAAHIEVDLGVKVVQQNRRRLLQSPGDLLQFLRDSEVLREEISEAEVVTVWPGSEDMFTALTSGYVDCAPLIEPFERALDALIAEILALREDEDIIVRLLDHYIWVNRLKEAGRLDEKKVCHEAINKAIHDVGARHGVPVAPVAEAFNGPTGTEDPGDKGYLGYDGWRLSEEGDGVVADLLRELGYESIVP